MPEFPTYRNRYLAALNLDEIAAIPDKAHAAVVVPVGAIEQHGPHLPVGLDSMMGQAWVNQLVAQLQPLTPCWIAPAVTVGKSNEHTGFPGTLMVDKTVLYRMLFVIAKQLHDWGFRSFLALNTHGGNIQVLKATLREIHDQLGMETGVLKIDAGLELDEQENTYGFHAGLVETSWMLAVAPELVVMDKATVEFPARIEDPGELRPEAAPAIFSWMSSDVSKTGVMGDATRATAELGEKSLEHVGKVLASSVEAFVQFLKSSNS